MKHKIMQNLAIVGKCLDVDDHLQKLSIQKKIFSQRMLDDIIKNKSSTLNYCMKLMCHDPNAFTQFTNILFEIKQNDIVDLL